MQVRWARTQTGSESGFQSWERNIASARFQGGRVQRFVRSCRWVPRLLRASYPCSTRLAFADALSIDLLPLIARGDLVLSYSAKLAVDRTRSTAWTLFKTTSPYLMLLFLVLDVTVWV